MKPSKELRRGRRAFGLGAERLEDRIVMSAGEGSTFAIMPGKVTAANQVSSMPFTISPTLFTTPHKNGTITIGLDVAPASASGAATSNLKPEIVSVTDSAGHVIHVQHSHYPPKVIKANKLGTNLSSAVTVTLKVPPKGQAAASYSVQVEGLGQTTGTYLLGFYLPGDIAGTGTVTKADLKTIKQDNGMTASNSKYSFDADVERTGIINHEDYAIAQKDLGVTTLVSPVVSVNLDPASDPAADRTTPYSVVHFAGQVTPNATVTFVDQSGGSSTSVTANSTGAYSIMVPLVSGSNTFTVTTHDGFGQSISGTITPVVYDPNSPNPTAATGTS
jgi:hypothetical protein